MTEKTAVLSRPLVVGRKRDGRRCYDPEAKRELIEACLRPGVSVAGMALDHGINANVLRKWIGGYRGPVASIMADPPVSLPAFAPVVSVMASEPPGFGIHLFFVQFTTVGRPRTDAVGSRYFWAHMSYRVNSVSLSFTRFLLTIRPNAK
jgi:transposase